MITDLVLYLGTPLTAKTDIDGLNKIINDMHNLFVCFLKYEI